METTQLTDIQHDEILWHGELDSPILAAWKSLLQSDSHARIFDYPEWIAFASQANCLKPWRIVQVRRGNRVVGLVPLQRRSPWTVEAAAIFSVDRIPLLLDPESESMALAGLMHWFVSRHNIHQLVLQPFGGGARKDELLRICHALHLEVNVRQQLPSIIIPLAENWEDYLSGLGQATRKNLRTTEKRLQRDFPQLMFEMLTEPSEKSNEVISELIRLYRLRWDEQRGGCFFHSAQNEAFFRRAIQWALESGYAAIPYLHLDGKVVAVLVLLHVPGRDCADFHLIARDTNALPNYYSPGTYIIMQSIRWAINRGVRCVNIGRGRSEQKILLGGVEKGVWEIAVSRSVLAQTLVPCFDRGLHIARRLPVHLHQRIHTLLRKAYRNTRHG